MCGGEGCGFILMPFVIIIYYAVNLCHSILFGRGCVSGLYLNRNIGDQIFVSGNGGEISKSIVRDSAILFLGASYGWILLSV